jgi:tetratricopeptide (TPR) repeat protein
MDLHAVEVSAWTAAQLKDVVEDYFALRKDIGPLGATPRATAERQADSHTVTYRRQRFDLAELRRMFGLDSPAADPNRMLRRAALLHVDVARLAAFDLSVTTGGPDLVLFEDGRLVGYGGHSTHWALGRQLLDAIVPDPATDRFVQLWYHATLAAMLSIGNLAEAEAHVAHALEVLPRDANVQYEAGFYHEANTSSDVVAVRTLEGQTGPSRRRPFDPSSARMATSRHLRDAERHYRRAIELDPGHAEARVRLAHVLLEQRNVRAALPELRRAAVEAKNPTLAYLAVLLWGRAEAESGHPASAADQYARAHALFPTAQSPVLALSLLARRSGDRSSAWQLLQPLMAGDSPFARPFDPWWNYYRWQQQSAEDLLRGLGVMVTKEGRR